MTQRPLLTSMDADYASYALSQLAAFERTFPIALEAARGMADVEVLRAVDLGAADGLNSHGLIRELAQMRDGAPMTYSLVDMPSNGWDVARRHLSAAGLDDVVVPAAGGPDAHSPTAAAHGAALDAIPAGTPLAIGLMGIPLHTGACVPDGTAHLAVSGTTLHWVEAPPSLGSTGSVFPGYPGHRDMAQREAWEAAAARQWRQLLHWRAAELAPGGVLVAAIPASERGGMDRRGLYADVVTEMNDILAGWVADGRIAQATADAVVVPVWMRTLDELRAPFDEGGGTFEGLTLEGLELVWLDNPYWDDDPAVFAHRYVQSCLAWGRPLFVGAFMREGDDRAGGLLDDFVAELERRVAADPFPYRRDYLEAILTCRKVPA